MQGEQGPTGLAGPDGFQGVAARGPPGPTGPQGISRPGYDSVTGPTGPRGIGGPQLTLPGTVVTLSTYGTGSPGLATPTVGSQELTTVWSTAIPSSIKGKAGVLSFYFDITLNYLDDNTSFDYGLFVDDAQLSLGNSATQRYTQTRLSSSLVGRGGVSLGTIAPTPLYPLCIPVAVAPSTNALQLKVRNVTSSIAAYVVSPTVSAFTTVGSNAYTSPVGSVGVLAYAWGGGGSPVNSNAGGAGGFSFGYYPAAAGTVFTVIVGGLATNTFLSGGGGSGGSGTTGGGGGFSGLFLGANPTTTVSTPLVIAGGGGGAFLTAGAGFRWVGGGGGGLVGASAFNLSSATFSGGAGNGASQGGAGSGGARWIGAPYVNAGAGGGGFFGGGGNLTSGAGGGGSGYVDPAVLRPFRGVARTATTEVSPGEASQIRASGSDIMLDLSYNPATYGHGGGGQGLVVLIPVTGTSAPQIGVDARFSAIFIPTV